MCSKQKHKKRMGACGQAISLMRSSKFKGGVLRVYKCTCGCFHVTHKNNAGTN